MDLSLLLPVISLIFTVVSKLLLLYSTIDKTSMLKMKSFSTVRVTQRGSQCYMEKRRGRRELEVTQMPLQYSCLENPTDGAAWLATDLRVAKVATGHAHKGQLPVTVLSEEKSSLIVRRPMPSRFQGSG